MRYLKPYGTLAVGFAIGAFLYPMVKGRVSSGA